MMNKISIVISKNPDGYLVKFPELEPIDYQDSSLEGVLNRLKDALETHLISSEVSQEETTGESILKIVDQLNLNFPEEELEPLPPDGAEEHDHYLYGSPKKRQ
jgi:predicted RNase H-like HicB family nuclease